MYSSDRKHEPNHHLTHGHLFQSSAINHLFILLLILSIETNNQNNATANCQSTTSYNVDQINGRGLAASEGPDFEEPIGNFTVAVGKDVQLPCKISRLANFRSAWLRVEDRGVLTIHTNVITPNYRIGLRVEDEGQNFMLTIKNVQPSDKGAYMCQINTVPMRSTIGYLNVLTPPVFELDSSSALDRSSQLPANQPQAQPLVPDPPLSLVTSQEKGNVSLSCRATGNPAPTITWRREDNEPIRLNGQSSTGGLTKVDGSTLFLSQVSRLSSGAYLCIASNGVLPSPSRRLTLDVQYAPVITLPQTEVGAQLSHDARLICFVDSNPSGNYHWVRVPTRAGSPVSAAGREDVEDDKSLLESNELVNSDKFELITKQINSEKVQMILGIRKVDKYDYGLYRCIAENPLGSQSSSIRLHESAASSLSSLMFAPGLASTGGRVELFASSDKLSPRTPANRIKSRPDSLNGQQDRSPASSSLLQPSTSCLLTVLLILVSLLTYTIN